MPHVPGQRPNPTAPIVVGPLLTGSAVLPAGVHPPRLWAAIEGAVAVNVPSTQAVCLLGVVDDTTGLVSLALVQQDVTGWHLNAAVQRDWNGLSGPISVLKTW